MKADYELVRDYVGIDKPFDVKTTYTNEFLDPLDQDDEVGRAGQPSSGPAGQ